jgi:hypothetical protein
MDITIIAAIASAIGTLLDKLPKLLELFKKAQVDKLTLEEINVEIDKILERRKVQDEEVWDAAGENTKP